MLTVLILIYTLPFLLLVQLFTTWYRHRSIPGPLLGKFTNLERFLSVLNRNPHNEQLSLHRRHGDLVRLGPNTISVSGPDYIPQIYGIGKGLVKSDFYAVFQNVVNGRRTASLVAVTDESEHARTKRHVANAYSLSTLVEFEGFVDSTTEVFLAQLEERFAGLDRRRPCDLGTWLQYYAFEVISELTFSKRLGFVERGEDVGGIIGSIGANFDYFSVLGQMPWLDGWLGKNPVYVRYFRQAVTSPILKFAQRLLRERSVEDEEGGGGGGGGGVVVGSEARKDFLTRFLMIRKESTEPASDAQMLSYLFMNINAGSDTIASTLRGIFYNLLKNRSSLSKLVAELDAAVAKGELSLPTPTWHETQSEHVPYLRAVIKEGLRMNPALSLPLERIVPPGGMTLSHPKPTSKSSSGNNNNNSTTFLPAGTIIGINPYVIQRDPRIFEDPDTWNPERWLVPDDEEKLKRMDHHILAFGAGKRSCMGKNIAMLELSKLVPALVARFEIELEHPEKEWVVRNGWALNQTGVVVRLKRREGLGAR